MAHYNLDDIRTDIKKDIARNNAYIAAWKAVTFPTKKDGKPFAVMSKNISGAKYALESYAMQPGEYELTVYTSSIENGYIHDTIKAHDLICYMKDENMLAKKENYQPKQTWLEQVYTYDLDDIKHAVANRIEYLESYVADLEKQLKRADHVFKAFRDAYDAAIKTLESETADFQHKDLMYAVKDTVLARYPYV